MTTIICMPLGNSHRKRKNDVAPNTYVMSVRISKVDARRLRKLATRQRRPMANLAAAYISWALDRDETA